MNILFLCTGNSCRSIIAEALFNAMSPVGVIAQSTGSKPAGFVHPAALAVLREAGFSAEGLTSKSWHNLPEKPDAVITLCADAADEACPLYFGKVVRSHWGIPDPAKVQGDKVMITAAFTETLVVLGKRINALVKQLAAQPGMDAARLQEVLNAVAEL